MKFKITEITTSSVKVQYENGTWASVPVSKGQNKNTIHDKILSYVNEAPPFDKVSDVPVTVSSDYIEVTRETDPTVDYQAARAYHYPQIGDQLDALHWAREGDDTTLKAVDENIKTVKSKIPKGSTYKNSQVKDLLN